MHKHGRLLWICTHLTLLSAVASVDCRFKCQEARQQAFSVVVQELKEHNIRVTTIFPAYVASDMTKYVHLMTPSVQCYILPPSHCQEVGMLLLTSPGDARREVQIDNDKMILPEDIALAALLPFQMSANACPTDIVIGNTVTLKKPQA